MRSTYVVRLTIRKFWIDSIGIRFGFYKVTSSLVWANCGNESVGSGSGWVFVFVRFRKKILPPSVRFGVRVRLRQRLPRLTAHTPHGILYRLYRTTSYSVYREMMRREMISIQHYTQRVSSSHKDCKIRVCSGLPTVTAVSSALQHPL